MTIRKWFWAVFQLFSGKGITPDLFDLNYFLRKDPWNYRRSDLEQGKYQDILSLLPPRPIAEALEVGCAEGVFTKMLSSRVETLTGVDSSPTALSRARQALTGIPRVELQQMDIGRQNPEGRFDLVVASEILYYLGSNEQIADVGRRMLDWLNPGGYLLLCHMRTQVDEEGGFPVPRWTPKHPGASTVHGIFDQFAGLERLKEIVRPLYRVSLYRRSSVANSQPSGSGASTVTAGFLG